MSPRIVPDNAIFAKKKIALIMAVSLITSPFKWAWAKNRNHFVFQCDSLVTVGTRSNFAFRMPTILPYSLGGMCFVLVIDGMRYVWERKQDATGVWEFASTSSLANRLSTNYYIGELYDVTAVEQGQAVAFAFNAKAVGRHTVDVFLESSSGERFANGNLLTVGHVMEGSDPDRLQNYSLAVAVDVLTNNYNNVTQGTTDWMFFQPDESGRVEVPLEVLRSFVPQPDIPSFAEPFVLQLMTNLFLKYRIRWAEVWGDTPRLQAVEVGEWCYAFCGEESDYHHRLNLPDWQDYAPAAQLSSARRTLFRVIGEDSGKMVDVRPSQPEFLTIFYYNAQESINSSVQMRVRLDKTDRQGRTATTWIEHTVKNGNVYRLSVGPAAVSASASAMYSVTLCTSDSEAQFSRTYRLVPDFYERHLFLMQTKWGTLATLCVPRLTVDSVTEGDSLRMRHRHYVGMTDRYQKFTAETAALRKDEAERVGRSLASAYHYYQHNGAWQRIAITPGTVTYKDDGEDMMVVSFTFRYVENQADNMPSNRALSTSNQQLVTANIEDDAGAYVSFGVRMTPQTNALHDE